MIVGTAIIITFVAAILCAVSEIVFAHTLSIVAINSYAVFDARPDIRCPDFGEWRGKSRDAGPGSTPIAARIVPADSVGATRRFKDEISDFDRRAKITYCANSASDVVACFQQITDFIETGGKRMKRCRIRILDAHLVAGHGEAPSDAMPHPTRADDGNARSAHERHPAVAMVESTKSRGAFMAMGIFGAIGILGKNEPRMHREPQNDLRFAAFLTWETLRPVGRAAGISLPRASAFLLSSSVVAG
jgi:hypothetical protein